MVGQLSGANSSPTVTKLRQSYPWPQEKKVIKLWKVKVDGAGMRSTERPSSFLSVFCYLVRTLDLFHNFRCFTNTVKLRYNGLMGTPLKRPLHQKSIISKPVSLTGHRNVCLAPPTASWRSTQLTTPTPQQWSSCLLGAEDDTTTWKPMLSHRAVTGSRVFSNIINWSCRQPRCKKRMVSCMIT